MIRLIKKRSGLKGEELLGGKKPRGSKRERNSTTTTKFLVKRTMTNNVPVKGRRHARMIIEII